MLLLCLQLFKHEGSEAQSHMSAWITEDRVVCLVLELLLRHNLVNDRRADNDLFAAAQSQIQCLAFSHAGCCKPISAGCLRFMTVGLAEELGMLTWKSISVLLTHASQLTCGVYQTQQQRAAVGKHHTMHLYACERICIASIAVTFAWQRSSCLQACLRAF